MLEELTLHQLDQEVEAVEALIDQTAEIDPWCSCPDWVLSTHYAFASAVEPLVLANTDRTGYALLARYVNEENTPIVTSLEPMWGFASPVIAADPATFGSELADHLNELNGWDILALPGLPLPKANGGYTVKLLQSLSVLGHVRAGSGITRQVARISAPSGGYSGWLERRSPKFRRNLKRIQQAADDAGVSIIDASGDKYLFDRILDIEKLSWKGAQNSGITSSEMRALYSLLTIRLEEKGRLQVWVARQNGRDIGYILGAVRNQLYRGLQVSYIEDVSDLSIGHLLQHHQIRALTSGDAVAERYDLGMDIDYKQSWADFGEPSIVLVLERSASEGI